MNCPNCGTSNPETSSLCANCGRPLSAASASTGGYAPPPPPSAQASYTPPPPPSRPGGSFNPPPPVGEKIPNYLVWSILLTICCCQPVAIIAIVFGAMVNSRLQAGDVAGALQASKNAKICLLIAAGLTLLGWIIAFATGLSGPMLEAIRDAAQNR